MNTELRILELERELQKANNNVAIEKQLNKAYVDESKFLIKRLELEKANLEKDFYDIASNYNTFLDKKAKDDTELKNKVTSILKDDTLTNFGKLYNLEVCLGIIEITDK